MPFVRDLNPFYDSNEREKELAIQRQAQQNQQTQQMLQLAMQGVGMGLRQYNESQDRGLRQQGLDQQQNQFEASQAQQLKEYTDKINYDRSWRDEQIQQKKATDQGAVKLYEQTTGQKWDGAPPDASILSPFISKKLEFDYNQADQQNDIPRKVALGQALQYAETKHWQDYAPIVADKLGKFSAKGILPEEIAQQYADRLQSEPASSRVIDTELDKLFFTHINDEMGKLKTQKITQQLGAWGTDPTFADAHGEEAQARALVASKGLELGVWTDPADAMAFVFPKKQGGTSEFERNMAGSGMSPDQMTEARRARVESQTGTNRPIKDPNAIGSTAAEVSHLKAQIDNFTERANNATDEAKRAQYLQNAQKLRERLGDAEGAAAKARAGTARTPVGTSSPMPQQPAPPAQNAIATALQKFKAKHDRAPDKNNPDDVAEMRALAGG